MRPKPEAEIEKSPAPKPIRIVLVDDHIFMRELICTTLHQRPTHHKVLASVGTAVAAVGACAKFRPDLVILDINLPDRSGMAIIPKIKRVSPGTHVLLCTAYPTTDRLVEALRAGAKGFVEKTNTWEDFLGAIDRVGRGEQYFSSKSSGVKPLSRAALAQRARRYVGIALSPREVEVLKLIAGGGTSKEIAGKLFISAATVETHRANVMSKINVRNVAGLVLYAFQHGLVEGQPQPSPPSARRVKRVASAARGGRKRKSR